MAENDNKNYNNNDRMKKGEEEVRYIHIYKLCIVLYCFTVTRNILIEKL
jgi:hypothetical protein